MAGKKCPHCDHAKKTKLTPPFEATEAKRNWLFMRLTYGNSGEIRAFAGIGTSMTLKKWMEKKELKAGVAFVLSVLSLWAFYKHKDALKPVAAGFAALMSGLYLLGHLGQWLCLKWMVSAMRYPDPTDDPDPPKLGMLTLTHQDFEPQDEDE